MNEPGYLPSTLPVTCRLPPFRTATVNGLSNAGSLFIYLFPHGCWHRPMQPKRGSVEMSVIASTL